MNKTLAMVIKETKMNLVEVCNNSQLHPTILDMIMRELSTDIHNLAENQILNEEMAYKKSLEESMKKSESELELKADEIIES